MSTKRSRRQATKSELILINNNARAVEEGPVRKHWTKHDLRAIRPLTENQHDMFRQYFQGDNIVAYGSAGTGKAQPLHSKIMTPSGWKLMGEIKVGDWISTPSGSNAKVVGIFPQGQKDIYKITFDDGSSTECCKEHLWSCNVPYDFYNSKGSEVKVVDTQFLIDWLHKKSNAKQKGKKVVSNISIPVTKPVEFSEKSLLIHPYLLGTLLGDGCISYSSPVLSSAADDEIIANVTALIDEEHNVKQIANSLCDYRIVRAVSKNLGPGIGMQQNGYTEKIKRLGLFGKRSHEKFIPEEYLQGSILQRTQLLQGLMDTDGTVGPRGDISFSSSSPILAHQVQQLVWSLGGKASVKIRQPSYTYKEEKKPGKPSYWVSISMREPKSCFTLQRKQERCSETYQNKQLRRQIVSIERTSTQEAQCIMVDHKDHLYITDDYVVTHNTFLALYLAMCDVLDGNKPQDHIIIVRSAVTTRELGFMPGTLEEKVALFENPYRDVLNELFGRFGTYDNMKEANLIRFVTTSYVRGLTWDDAVIIVDEGQNMTDHEIHSIMTRVGNNSRVIFTGDLAQNDLINGKKTEKSGMKRMLKIIDKMKEFSSVCFTTEDIVRSDFVKAWIVASESVNET